MDDFSEQLPVTVPGLDAGQDATPGVSTPDDAVAHGFRLPDPAARGKLAAVFLPPYLPETDLLWVPVPEDDPTTPAMDESRMLPRETWPPADRPILVNIGGNRVAVVAQELWFDATRSQGDHDAVIASASWDWGDSTTATGLTVKHAWATAGTYAVTCTVGTASTTRYVRVLNDLGESDLDVTGLQLGASGDGGWKATFQAHGDIPAIADFQGLLLYVYDDQDVSWRVGYESSLRHLARRTAYTGAPAPDPIWEITTINRGHVTAAGTQSAVGSLAALGSPSGDTWATINRYDAQILREANRQSVPPNLLKAIVYVESGGEATLAVPTGNAACPSAYGLVQVACGCAPVPCPSDRSKLLDPATNLALGAKELAAHYASCGTWDGAIVRYYTGSCLPDGTADALGQSDHDYLRVVRTRWQEADEATPAIGGGYDGPLYGEVIFDGYIAEILAQEDGRESDRIAVEAIGSAQVLETLSRRREAFFENASGGDFGGTVMGTPMRTASMIHHTLSAHTNFAERHDVLLDWSGPRIASSTANEGTMWGGFAAWADNDFARLWSDRHGRFRYEPLPHYRGKAWYDEAIAYAARVDPSLILDVAATERTLGQRTTWVKLCGMSSTGGCEICTSYPCDGPRTGDAGQWVLRRGLQYDDYRVLCAMAAHHYAYLNRRWDLEVTLAWRHDLEVNDLLSFPIADPSGAFDWRLPEPPVFVVTAISHQYDTAAASWVSRVSLEQLTYGVPCDCPRPKCPKQEPVDGDGDCNPDAFGFCAPGPDPDGFAPDCRMVGADAWTTWAATRTVSSGESLEIESYTCGINLTHHYTCSCTVIPLPTFPFACSIGCETVRTDSTVPVGCTRWVRTPWEPVNTQTESETPGTPWQLDAAYGRTHETTSGGASASLYETSESVSYADFDAVGPLGASMAGELVLRARVVEGTAEVYLFDLGVGGSLDLTPPVDIDDPGGWVDEGSLALRSRTEVAVTPFTGYRSKLLARIDRYGAFGLFDQDPVAPTVEERPGFPLVDTGRPVEGSGSLAMSLTLPSHPQGHRYRLGVRCTGGLVSQTVDDSVHYIEVYGQTNNEANEAMPKDTGYCDWKCSSIPGRCMPGQFSTSQHAFSYSPPLTAADFLHNETTTDANGCVDVSYDTVAVDLTTRRIVDTEVGTVSLEASIAWETCRWIGPNGELLPPGEGPYPASGPVGGVCPGWPSASAIDDRIAASERANGRESPLGGLGATFLSLGRTYGVNPGVVAAILQRESQLGADGSVLPNRLNNFGGVTGSGPCGTEFIGDRSWKKYCTPAQGLEGVFQTLDGALYRATGGDLAAIMELYSPAFENDVAEMWQIFGTVGGQLGIALGPTANVYAGAECTGSGPMPGGGPIPAPPSGLGYGGYTTMLEWSMHQVGMNVSQGPFGIWSHSVCDCYDFACPIGTPIYPVASGTVIVSEATSGVYTPNMVVVRTVYGDLIYAHLTSRAVAVGESVQVGTLLGYSGTAGTGPHLHLGLQGGAANSPMGYTLTQILQAVGFNVGSFGWSG